MAEADTAWVMYTAKYDTGRFSSRIIPDSVRVLRISKHEFGWDEQDAEWERIGTNNTLLLEQIDVPLEVASENLAAYAERYISLEPRFDFWDDVIGDDIVVGGIAYDGTLYGPDGEGGVRRLTEAERAERETSIREWEAEREAEQTAREAQRRRQAIDYATTTSAAQPPTRQDVAVADDAIGRFLHYQESGMDIADARREATIEAAWDHAVAARTREPANAYPPGIVPAMPALGGFRIAEEAIDQFVSLKRSGLGPGAARELAVKLTETPEHPSVHNPEAELDLSPGPTPSLVAGLRQRATDLRAELDNGPTSARQDRFPTPPDRHSAGVHLPRPETTTIGADDPGSARTGSPDVGL